MFSSLVARDIEKGLKSYINCEFPVVSKGFLNSRKQSFLEEYLERPNAIVKGPWAEVKLPFRTSDADASLPFTKLKLGEVAPGITPYDHQRKAFERLQWKNPKSTIVATGTGSGKTECFLYPIADYCLEHQDKAGIKAILIYPMNALATDQAKRIKKLIDKLPAKNGRKIRAGIYTGESGRSGVEAEESGLITKREAMRRNPPDILLTNYKMLDFLLLRPEDQPLWKGCDADTLRYLVVDELHTFDGAQGTDLACLIRRLRDRLNLLDTLACIGTSATIGGKDSIEALCRYASSVFATGFAPDAVIQENRLSPQEFLDSFGPVQYRGGWPDASIVEAVAGQNKPQDYFQTVVPLWFGDDLGFFSSGQKNRAPFNLAQALPSLEGFRRLIRDMNGVTNLDALAVKWDREIAELKSLGSDRSQRLKAIRVMIDSLIAMIAEARTGTEEKPVPFLNVRTQLWVHTISRAVVSVSRHPKLERADDLKSLTKPLYLPVVGCRECNQVAWATHIEGGPFGSDVKVRPDLSVFYQNWFSQNRDTVLLYPVSDSGFYEQNRGRIFRICSNCGSLESVGHKNWSDLLQPDEMRCKCGSSDTLLVWIPETETQSSPGNGGKVRFSNRCPHCRQQETLRIFGAASSSLTAAMVDHIHASAYSGDNKIIAFSDSVQDAAQRAGFLEARDFAASCRHALVSCLNTFTTPGGVGLNLLLRKIPAYWLDVFKAPFTDANKEVLGQAAFLATFVAPDKQWLQSWKNFDLASRECRAYKTAAEESEANAPLIASHKIWEEMYKFTKERLVWEALVELGFRSENGRTAARTEMAVAFPSETEVKSAASRLAAILNEEFKYDVSEEAASRYLSGFLYKMKLMGAFDVSELKQFAPNLAASFGGYAKTGNNYTAFNQSFVLPTYGTHLGAPTILTWAPVPGDRFNVSVTNKRRATWFTDWARKNFGSNAFVDAQIEDILRRTVEVLSDKLLVRIDRTDEVEAWALNTSYWKVTKSVTRWRCAACGRRYYGTDSLWNGMLCQSRDCFGTLSREESSHRNGLYLAPPVRIHAREHTSIIDSDERRFIENSFANTNYPWSVNLLSATPTLEMGIDIGDLSTVILCSMPPEQANYLQRIGRAGRRDGNALALTVVDKSAHDQYFWQEPKEMLEGEVSTPGVFLRAVAVLERQLLAFALGRWVCSTTPAPKLPNYLTEAINNLSDGSNTLFPNNFLAWVSEGHADELYNAFIRLFESVNSTEISEDVRRGLKQFITGDAEAERLSLAARVRQAFENAKLQKEDFRRNISELTDLIRRLKARAQDEATKNEIESLQQQKAALQDLVSHTFDKKQLFNFFTDEGLLPNYAFPEEGVQVHSVILKKREKAAADDPGAKKKPYIETFEFNRAAGQALRELAPASLFYAKEHILHVDQLHVTKESFEEWRFCPDCAHAERVDHTKPAPEACPRCGNTMFGDSGQIRTLIRIRQLTATADARKDRIVDDRENRMHTVQTRQVLIDVDPSNDIDTAWRIKDERFNFGFEFLKRVTIREINFGSENDGFPVMIAGRKFPSGGFTICRHCGKVHPGDDKKVRLHDPRCPFYGKTDIPVGEKGSPWIKGLFLYREVVSEAIRIRIPVCDMIDAAGANIGEQSFISAIQLGLRRHFRGSVDHLQISVQTEPVENSSSARNRYIVIYDTIPGGSGYLKDLCRLDAETKKPLVMQEMFRRAWDAVAHCDCARNPEKDGCYRCVYQYRDFSARSSISRAEAEAILERIAGYGPDKIEMIKSLSELSSVDLSALEKLFIKRLSDIPQTKFSHTVSKTGEIGYELVVELSEKARASWLRMTGGEDPENVPKVFTWTVKMQQDFKENNPPSRPDFTIMPRSESLRDRFPALTSHIFTDGWEFHARIIGDDAKKRQAILNKGFRVWSLTWTDLAQEAENTAEEAYGAALLSNVEGEKRSARNICEKAFGAALPAEKRNPEAAESCAASLLGSGRTNFDWLIAWLLDPFGFSEQMRDAVRFASLSKPVLQVPKGTEPEKALVPLPLMQKSDRETARGWFTENGRLPFTFASSLIQEEEDGKKAFLVAAAVRMDEAPFNESSALKDVMLRRAWAEFWQTANALQFADRAFVCTVGSEKDPVFETFYDPARLDLSKPCAPNENDVLWQEFFDEFTKDEEFFAHIAPAAQSLVDAQVTAPLELVDGVGTAIICAGQGLMWKKDGRTVYLFAAEDLDSEIPEFDPNTTTVITTANSGWLEQLIRILK
jgi:DEAD/DEAH box helicase domain-containing protein